MTKLEQMRQALEQEGTRQDRGVITALFRAGVYSRNVLHVLGVKGTEDGQAVLCTDGHTIGLHRLGLCPFLSTPDGGK